MNYELPQSETLFDNSVENNPQFAGDSRLFVTFYKKAVLNHFKSEAAARPIYDEKTYVRIITPADKLSIYDQPSEPIYERRFPKQFAKFKANESQAVTGTPLEVWPQLSIGQVAELKGMNVFTVEQLAEMPDGLAQNIMGNHKLRQKAQAFLMLASGESQTNQLTAELEKRDNEIETLRNQIANLAALIEQSQTDKKVVKLAKNAKDSVPDFINAE
jgi:hypothetical protein